MTEYAVVACSRDKDGPSSAFIWSGFKSQADAETFIADVRAQRVFPSGAYALSVGDYLVFVRHVRPVTVTLVPPTRPTRTYSIGPDR